MVIDIMSSGVRRVLFSRQKGAALLAYLLVVIAASSYFLVNKLNANIIITRGVKESRTALNLAKQALIGYAVSYPDRVNGEEGPGYLPCPDRDKDGDAEGNCANNFPNFNTVGRLPYETLELPELRDSSGQRLWYILSENFRGGSNKIIPLNSESPAQAELTINNTNDIVAVIIAPGAPVGSQDRDPAETNIVNEITNYLEDDNNDFDTTYVTSAAGDFNDIVIAITRGELMRAVEKRVIGEVSQILTAYNNLYGAFPWLTAFADPKATARPLSGTHNGANNAADLTDTTVDFNDWGVATGDVVRNITDGSMGTVTAVTANTLTIGAGLDLGTDNDFDDDDKYVVHISGRANILTGTATIGSNNLTLEDNTQDFDEIGVAAGDIVHNLDDGSSGMVESVTSTEITAKYLTGGGTNSFNAGDNYKIRSNTGIITTADDNTDDELNLIDANTDFSVMGVQTGQLVINETDGSFGFIEEVPPDTANDRIIVKKLFLGTGNDFDAADTYSIPRFNTNNASREGLISFHEPGELFEADLNIDLLITAAAGDITVTNSSILQTFIQNYVSSGNILFDNSINDVFSACAWFTPDVVDCYGYFLNFLTYSGTLTSGSNSVNINDSTATFITDGIKLGDMAINYDDEPTFILTGTVDAGESGTATADTDANGLTLEDTNNNFTDINVSPGTTIFNTTDGSSGAITSVSANQITVSSLSGGSDNSFQAGDNYRIDGDPVLYDASTNFSVYERYSYVIQNNTLEIDLSVAKIQGVLSDIIGNNSVVVKSYVGESSTPIQFRPGDTYVMYTSYKTVVTSVPSEVQVITTGFTGTNVAGVYPDFDSGEYYRVIPAGNSYTGTVGSVLSTGATDRFRDLAATLVTLGVEPGDVIRNNTTGAYGAVTAVVETGIDTTLYNGSFGGTPNDFTAGDSYTVFFNYVYSRELILHARYKGDLEIKNLTQQRVRDVCLGYSSDCSTAAAAVNFSGNGGVPLITITDYEEDEITEAGSATFTPTAASSGRIRVSNLDFYLADEDISGISLPAWFASNNWHQLVYIAYSADYVPGGAADCFTSGNCLTLEQTDGTTTLDNNTVGATVFISGEEIQTERNSACTVVAAVDQTRADATINEYFELENCDSGDDEFQQVRLPTTLNFNDQSKIVN